MAKIETFYYDNKIVRNFAYATIFWGVVGFLVGLVLALQTFIPETNFGIPFLSFSHLRPLHTNIAIFALVGNAIFMGVYYSLQRLLKARMLSNLLSIVHFWGWQFIILCAVITIPLGFTTGKAYAELEWPIDILITIIWIVFGVNMIGTISKRRERKIYIAIWFYVVSFFTIAIIHIFNSVEIPVTLFKSYPVFSGAKDALVQCFYGHNLSTFLLIMPYFGLMYYFVPKAANRPVYSYRLAIGHFGAMVFLYSWAAPQQLLLTSIPDWLQSLGMVFSLMVFAPALGGMANGLLTLKGDCNQVWKDPILRMMAAALIFFGISAFDAAFLSVKSISAFAHNTDLAIAEKHIGAMGWNGLLTFAILYWLIPKIYNTKLFSQKLTNIHFWLAVSGILIYTIPLYWAGVTQGFMWQEFTSEGYLQYPIFMDTVLHVTPAYIVRAVGGLLYLMGAVMMVVNLAITVKVGSLVKEEEAEAPALEKLSTAHQNKGSAGCCIHFKPIRFFVVLTIIAVIGGLVEIIPMFLVERNVPAIDSVNSYTPLELEGRDIYIREGCNTCHTQQIRPLRSETERNGEFSMAGEFIYDYPSQWGSKRNGPDLQRIGGKYPDAWHYTHIQDPKSMSVGSTMPAYPWLITNELDISSTDAKIRAMQILGVPYSKGYDQFAIPDMKLQALNLAEGMEDSRVKVEPNREIIALIAYLQRLGTDIKVKETEKK
ncbi:MAG: cytochrome-c oxidase, cbb3-type subunit II [Candidatus Cloacimonetes bacterium 4572_55]|nr:MAG: cytochrome-c oxidase, cbb3-type subunit II [Candidatus Cloacimonetes bacterium 4572_55]